MKEKKDKLMKEFECGYRLGYFRALLKLRTNITELINEKSYNFGVKVKKKKKKK
jgi:hypothetical protein